MSLWSVNEVMESAALKFKNRPALIEGDREISFSELRDDIVRTAAWLQSKGVTKGSKVAIQGRNSISWIVVFFATLRAGGVAVPLNHKLAPAEVGYILDNSQSCLWLVDSNLHAESAKFLSNAPPAFALDKSSTNEGLTPYAPKSESHSYEFVTVVPEDLAELLYTSGTTGRPKGCMHSHANIILAGLASSSVYGLSFNDRVLIAMPIWHSFPLNNLLVSSIYYGATCVLMPEYQPQTFLETIQDKACTLFFGAPIAYLMPIRMVPNFDKYNLSTVRAWIYGGGPIDAKSAITLMERYKTDSFFQVFGMTETGPTGTALLPDEQVSKAGSIGRFAVSGSEVKVMRSEEIEALPGETGEIWIRCQSMMLGYYGSPELSESVLQDGWYKTGDLVRIDDEGYLFIVDRLKDMIVTGGENVYSKEVEDVLSAHPTISDLAVIGIPHKDWGETVTAVIVPKAGQTVNLEEMRIYCAQFLAKYKIPRRLEIVDDIPRTPTGKVRKYLLRDRYS